ncbi:MAG: arginine--tRNA ligase [Planctomycetaceae bacterium]|nr:arginine--tRNA ligase [Planctomycetaceae bacterium]
MNIHTVLKERFALALDGLTENITTAVEMIRPSQEPKFGDYQANMAMSLGKQLGKPPREVAEQIVVRLDVSDLCEPPEIAGPGFINLRLKSDWLAARLQAALADPRLGVGCAARVKTYVIDYSAPNVAKPMHVGHIRSTMIGNALARLLRFYGHKVITDNHIGDWGTQFGMILYGYKHFLDRSAYAAKPVDELARLYRLVRKLVDYHRDVAEMPQYEQRAVELRTRLEDLNAKLQTESDAAAQKKLRKDQTRLHSQILELLDTIKAVAEKIRAIHDDPATLAMAKSHPDIGRAVQEETSKLHHGDAENLALWNEFVPLCMEDIERIYRRLNVTFDHTLGESFYNDRLPELVERLLAQGIARETDGAVGVFLPGRDIPMLVRKKDGAFLYATTDLATIEYRMETFRPDAILYLTDFRQSLHFEQLFATARFMGYHDLELTHVKFGTVLGEDSKPFKTRSGDTVGLESLLDEAERRACKIRDEGSEGRDEKEDEPLAPHPSPLAPKRIGIGALVYADLSQNRESDYVFSYDKMLAMNGNTATYLQYAYARVQSIFARGKVDIDALRNSDTPLHLEQPVERDLALDLLKFEEAIELSLQDYRPNVVTAYLYDLANRYASFFEQCPVLRAENESIRTSRLRLCDLVARTMQLGLELLGIETVERM